MTGIVVNCRFLSQPVTGVQRFAGQICQELKNILPDVEFVAPRSIIDIKTASILGAESIGRSSGHLWEQVDLPLYLQRNNRPLLVNLANTGPLLYKNHISTLHDITLARYPKSFSLPFRLAYKVITPRIVRSCNALITVSEFSKNEIASHYAVSRDKIYVVHNATDERFTIRKPSASPGKYLLAVSSPAYHKNFPTVIAAYKRWRHRKEIDLKIVGTAGASLSPQSYGDLPAGLDFLGRISDDQLIDLYTNAIGFIFPSLYEGFGIPPLEAQACGCPVIASNTASMPEVLCDSALYFDPNNVDQLTEAMDSLLCEPQRQAWIQKGLVNSARFDWKLSAEKVASIINST